MDLSGVEFWTSPQTTSPSASSVPVLIGRVQVRRPIGLTVSMVLAGSTDALDERYEVGAGADGDDFAGRDDFDMADEVASCAGFG